MWIGSESVQCSGTVWSEGPWPRSLWVTPDGEPRPVLVTLPTPSKAQRGYGAVEQSGSGERAMLATLRAEMLRAHGSVFAVSHGKRVVNGHYHYSRESEIGCLRCAYPEHIVTWHADRGCSRVEDRPLAPDYVQSGRSLRDVLDVVLGVRQDWQSPSQLCDACIWQTEPARVEVSA